MTFKEHWLMAWHGYMSYLEEHKRCLSKYHLDNKRLVNWLKYNQKLANKGKLCAERAEKLHFLLLETEKYRRKNQHMYFYLKQSSEHE